MSRIGYKPIEIPKGVTVELKPGNLVEVKGPKGVLSQKINPLIELKQEENILKVDRKANYKQIKGFHGLYRSLINNMVVGVSQGYERELEVVGVGYKVEEQPNGLIFGLGFSHVIYFQKPPGIEFEVERPLRRTIAEGTKELLICTIKIKGIDKQLVGQVCAKLKSLKKPNIYKGKGIRFKGEKIHLKPVKAAI
ncbi:50S ribosomal protein L6 [bacterium]|nr:50S ribosomal protein L6 [bacterium]